MKLITSIFCCLTALSLAAQSQAKPAAAAQSFAFDPLPLDPINPAVYQEPAQAKKLFQQRNDLLERMHQTRLNIIRADNQANEIYRQIVELNKQLTTIVETKQSMKDLSKELVELERKIQSLQKKEKHKPAGK